MTGILQVELIQFFLALHFIGILLGQYDRKMPFLKICANQDKRTDLDLFIFLIKIVLNRRKD